MLSTQYDFECLRIDVVDKESIIAGIRVRLADHFESDSYVFRVPANLDW